MDIVWAEVLLENVRISNSHVKKEEQDVFIELSTLGSTVPTKLVSTIHTPHVLVSTLLGCLLGIPFLYDLMPRDFTGRIIFSLNQPVHLSIILAPWISVTVIYAAFNARSNAKEGVATRDNDMT